MDTNNEIIPSTLTGKVLLQGIGALKQSDRKSQRAKYSNSQEGLECFRNKSIAYLENVLRECEESTDLKNTPYPCVETWTSYMGISRYTLSMYARRGEDWADVIMEIKAVIVSCKSQLADHSKIPPMTWVFDAANNYGYHNTSEFHISSLGETPIHEPKSLDQIAEEHRAHIGNRSIPEHDIVMPEPEF